MAFDGITVAALTKELRDTLLEGRVNKIAQPESDELLLTIKTSSGARRLYISASASLPLMYLTDENKPSPMNAPGFCMLLRKHINNGRIVDITQPGLERIIHFHIEHLDEMGDLCRKELIVELMGKHSNIIFCDDTGRIIDSIKHISSNMSSVREVLPGRTYFIPDTMHKLDSLSVNESSFTDSITKEDIPVAKSIYTHFTGISPMIAEQICSASDLDSKASASNLGENDLHKLFLHFELCMTQVKQGDFSPVVYYKDNIPKDFSCLSLNTDDSIVKKEYDSISKLLLSYYAEKNIVTRIRQKSSDLRKIVQTALDRNRKKYALQSKQLKDTDDREKYRVYGELINTYGYNLEPNAKSLECLNYYTNETVNIPMDPNKTPQENAQRYFAKYNKQKRTFEALSQFIQETQDDITYLESVSNALDIALSEEDLSQIKEELTESGFIRKRPSRKKGSAKSKPFHYRSSDGYDIYVGKNNVQNEELTFQVANGGDWWFHVKGAPGSHVIVKTRGDELPDRVFEEAGKLAAYYSKRRGADKVEIDYIERKHVKKVSGAKPGFVIYHTNYSLVIDSDISSLTLLES